MACKWKQARNKREESLQELKTNDVKAFGEEYIAHIQPLEKTFDQKDKQEDFWGCY